MCPACVASAASVAAGVTYASGLMAMVVSLFRRKPGARMISVKQEKGKTQKEK